MNFDQTWQTDTNTELKENNLKSERKFPILMKRKTDKPIFRSRMVFILNFMMAILVIAIASAGAIIYWGKYKFESNGPLIEPTAVRVEPGSNLHQISQQLIEQNVIENRWLFVFAVQYYQNENKLQTGEYLFKPGVSMRSVMKDLVSGNAIPYYITIPEGWSSYQIVEKIKSIPNLKGEITEVPAEGTLMPETYQYNYGNTRREVIDWMRTAHDKALSEVWETRNRDLPFESPKELLILASLVEKETTQVDERDHVAGVFVNRLKKGMRLQSDPTILYGVYGGEAWSKSRTILKTEKDQKNEYNTYKIPALPPGPIANVGRAALEAVANPKSTKDLYFVADGTGGHAFAETYDDHKINVAKWRKIEQERNQAKKAEN